MRNYLFSNLCISYDDMRTFAIKKYNNKSSSVVAQRLTRQDITSDIKKALEQGDRTKQKCGAHAYKFWNSLDTFVADGLVLGDLTIDHVLSQRVFFAIGAWFGSKKPNKPTFALSTWKTMQTQLNDLWNLDLVTTDYNRKKGVVEGGLIRKISTGQIESFVDDELQVLQKVRGVLAEHPEVFASCPMLRSGLNTLFKRADIDAVAWTLHSTGACVQRTCLCFAVRQKAMRYFNSFALFLFPKQICIDGTLTFKNGDCKYRVAEKPAKQGRVQFCVSTIDADDGDSDDDADDADEGIISDDNDNDDSVAISSTSTALGKRKA